jgi:hypothetical protein
LTRVGPTKLDPTQTLFSAAPTIIEEPDSPTPVAAARSSPFPSASGLLLHPKAIAEPNVWVPRKIEKEWRQLPTNEAQGKTTERRSLLMPQARAAGHPFFPTLHEWATDGVPVDCGPAWSWEAIETAVDRGPHQSAMDPESIALVHEDIQYQVDAGFCKIVTWKELQLLRPPNLKISLIAELPAAPSMGFTPSPPPPA